MLAVLLFSREIFVIKRRARPPGSARKMSIVSRRNLKKIFLKFSSHQTRRRWILIVLIFTDFPRLQRRKLFEWFKFSADLCVARRRAGEFSFGPAKNKARNWLFLLLSSALLPPIAKPKQKRSSFKNKEDEKEKLKSAREDEIKMTFKFSFRGNERARISSSKTLLMLVCDSLGINKTIIRRRRRVTHSKFIYTRYTSTHLSRGPATNKNNLVEHDQQLRSDQMRYSRSVCFI